MRDYLLGFALAVGLVACGLGMRQLHAQQTFSQQAALALDPTFQARVDIAMVSEAQAILATEAPGTANHAQHVLLAGQVLSRPGKWLTQFTLLVVADTTITGASTDLTILIRVAGVWDAMSFGTSCGP